MDTRDSSTVATRLGCLVDGEEAPPLPAVPPSPQEVFNRAPIPQPQVHINPLRINDHADGLVGFETWLWYEQGTEVTVDASVPGFTVVATVSVVELIWDMGNGDTVTATEAGSADSPAATYAYTNSCDCTVTLTARWGGTYTVTAAGAPAVTIDLGTRDYVGSRPYPVTEVEAVIGP